MKSQEENNNTSETDSVINDLGQLERNFEKSSNLEIIEIYNIVKNGALDHITSKEKKELYISHCIEIQNFIQMNFEQNSLNDNEFFVLLCSIWWHDIGNFMPMDECHKKPHNEISAEELKKFILEHPFLKQKYKTMLNKSVLLCASHTDYISEEQYEIINHCNKLKLIDEVYKTRDDLLCRILRIAELLETETKFCWPPWILDAFARCWPKEYQIKVPDVKIQSSLPHIMPICDKIFNHEIEILNTSCSQYPDLTYRHEICKFLSIAHYNQIIEELNNYKSSGYELNFAISVWNKTSDSTKYENMYSAFKDNEKLDKIFSYYGVYIDKEKISNHHVEIEKWLSIVSGDYLLDIFNDGKRALAEYEITMLKTIENKTSSYIELIYDSPLSIKYWEKGKSIGSIQLKSIDDLMFTLYYSMEFWCNDYEKWYQIDSNFFERELKKIPTKNKSFSMDSNSNT